MKAATVDGVWSCVGSSNLDWRSALDNDEANAVILGREFAQQMQAAYTGDIAAFDPIDLETWEGRSLLLRMKEWMARLWWRLLESREKRPHQFSLPTRLPPRDGAPQERG